MKIKIDAPTGKYPFSMMTIYNDDGMPNVFLHGGGAWGEVRGSVWVDELKTHVDIKPEDAHRLATIALGGLKWG